MAPACPGAARCNHAPARARHTSQRRRGWLGGRRVPARRAAPDVPTDTSDTPTGDTTAAVSGPEDTPPASDNGTVPLDPLSTNDTPENTAEGTVP